MNPQARRRADALSRKTGRWLKLHRLPGGLPFTRRLPDEASIVDRFCVTVTIASYHWTGPWFRSGPMGRSWLLTDLGKQRGFRNRASAGEGADGHRSSKAIGARWRWRLARAALGRAVRMGKRAGIGGDRRGVVGFPTINLERTGAQAAASGRRVRSGCKTPQGQLARWPSRRVDFAITHVVSTQRF